MNANELADYLKNKAEAELNPRLEQAATMLRQQQEEIERLIMLCDCMTTESNRKGNEIEALKIKHDAISCSSCACGFIKRGKASEK